MHALYICLNCFTKYQPMLVSQTQANHNLHTSVGRFTLPWVFEPSHLFSLLLSHPVYVHWLSQVILLLIQSLCVAALFTSSGFTAILFFHYSTTSNYNSVADFGRGSGSWPPFQAKRLINRSRNIQLRGSSIL